MENKICAKNITELSVITLMNGKKTRVALKNEDGTFTIKTMSVLTQYLNPNNDRKKMTKKIAKTIVNNFEYYIKNTIENESFDEMCAKALLFIYKVSGIDMTYLLDKTDDELSEKIIVDHLVRALYSIFKSLVGKEKINFLDIENYAENIVFYKNNKFKERDIYKFNDCDIEVSLAGYLNYIPNLNDEYPSYDEKVCDHFNIVLDLIKTDNKDDFIEKYRNKINIPYQNIVTENNWKKLYFIDYFKVLYNIKINFKTKKRNEYSYEAACYQIFRNKIFYLLDKKDTKANKILKESDSFERFIKKINEHIKFLRLQAQIDNELSMFGYNLGYTKNIHDSRQLITEMMDYLFYGVYAKIGRKDEKNKISEVWRDTITKYINGEQNKFTKAVSDAIYYRIEYNLKNKDYFKSLVWQFMYYAFGIDFYMISCARDWLALIKIIFNCVMKNMTIADIGENVELIFDNEQYKKLIHNKKPIRFTPYEIKYFRQLDICGLNLYEKLGDEIKISDKGFDVAYIKGEMTVKYIKIKMNRIKKKYIDTVEFAEKLFGYKSPDNYDGAILVTNQVKESWKCYILKNRCDELCNKLSITVEEIKEMAHLVSAVIIGSRINRLGYENIKNEFKDCVKKIASLHETTYRKATDKYKNKKEERQAIEFHNTNKVLWRCDLIQELYKWTKMILGYIVYSEWIDDNLKLK